MNHHILILIVEDEKAVRSFLAKILSVNHYSVIKAATGKEALSLATSYSPDLILLDLGLPDIDGLEVLKTVRGLSDIPVIVVSGRDHEREKVTALDLGADDYVTKPFGTSELLARIRVALRHGRQYNKRAAEEIEETVNGDLVVDHQKRIVLIEGSDVHLTPIEYKIVWLLSRHLGKVLTHDFIIREIWGSYYMKDNQILRVNMANIRRKIEKNPARPEYIVTDIGVGYMMPEKQRDH